MSKLNDEQKNLMRLYGRSKKDQDGWAAVSEQLWPWISKNAMPEMFDIGDKKIRLTEAGKTILEFAL